MIILQTVFYIIHFYIKIILLFIYIVKICIKKQKSEGLSESKKRNQKD